MNLEFNKNEDVWGWPRPRSIKHLEKLHRVAAKIVGKAAKRISYGKERIEYLRIRTNLC
jgi:hypothetical protein